MQLQLITTEDGSHSLYVPELKETYHSFHGALQESVHVFINRGLTDYLKNIQKRPIHILEVGLGTGLTALLVADWAAENEVLVSMTSLEAYPIAPALVQEFNYPDLLDRTVAKEWFNSIHESRWEKTKEIHSYFQLHKKHITLEEAVLPTGEFQIVFFDAFAPSKQPELWSKQMLQKVYNSQTDHSYFVTYSAKGQLKRDLRELNYMVETLDGPPGKKEMVRAIKFKH